MAKNVSHLGKKFLLAAAAILSTAAFLYGALLLNRTARLYQYIKNGNRGWLGQIYRPDPVLGYVQIPNSKGAQLFEGGVKIPVTFAEDGFRCDAAKSIALDRGTGILTLGDSFSFGYACEWEDTFAYLVGQSTHLPAWNASVSGYGLTQMLLSGINLVPKYKPKVIVAQYSPWLVDRSLTPWGPVFYGTCPVPYFAKSQKGELLVQSPPFLTSMFSTPINEYRNDAKDHLDFLPFVGSVGLPIFSYSDFMRAAFYASKLIASKSTPPTHSEVIRHVYSSLSELARQNGSRLLVLVLGGDAPEELIPLQSTGSLKIVDGEAKLQSSFTSLGFETYGKAYWPRTVENVEVHDQHPNKLAHRILAQEIAQALKPISNRR